MMSLGRIGSRSNLTRWGFEYMGLSNRSSNQVNSLVILRNFSSWPRLESATGRARKRRRNVARIKPIASILPPQIGGNTEEHQSIQPREKRPWEVLFPDPYNNPVGHEPEVEPRKKLSLRESIAVFKQAWAMYKETWGGSSNEKNLVDQDGQEKKGTDGIDEAIVRHGKTMKSNLEKNLEFTRREGAALLEETKSYTGIHTKDDLKAFAAEQMKLANACLKEFMSGYRQGRDEEIDRMLHEYFQDGDTHNGNKKDEDSSESKSSRKKRKPKQRIVHN